MYTLDVTSARFADKVRGCWIGKNCGGTLGTPLEEAWGRPEPFDIWWYPELQEGGLPNDDLEMQLVWLSALEAVGPGLTARDLARYWLDYIGYNFDEYGLSKTNLRLGLEPPVSGAFNNWFVDCMGSPIRSEIWACVAPASPHLAAKLAYEDAICDHAGGEGVYGELFNVAVQSAAFVVEDPAVLLDIGLSYVPDSSLTARAVLAAREAHSDGITWLEARARVLEAVPHHVAQFSPINIAFQVIGLLYGDDFGDSLCKTVNCGYDTDSSGGTIGSWLGILHGAAALPERWIEPFGEGISTNEDWGGVRNLSNGRWSVPRTLPALVERVVAMSARVLATDGRLVDGRLVEGETDELYADDAVRALWERSPIVVEHSAQGLDVAIDYGDGPAVAADAEKLLTTRLTNCRPDAMDVTASFVVPRGWATPQPQQVSIPPDATIELAWELRAPTRAHVDNSNRLFLDCRVAGSPQPPAAPVVLVGASTVAVAGPFPGDDATEQELLDRSFPPEDAQGSHLSRSGRGEDWREVSVLGNRLPLEDLLSEPGVLYIRTFLEAPEAIEVTLGVDASGPVTAWLNRAELFSACRHRPIRPSYAGHQDGYHVVALDSGWNEVLIKLVRGDDAPVPECHVVVSSGDRLKNGLPQIGRTRFPWD